MPRADDAFMLRFPEGMREEIRSEAKKNNRSMNAEIIHRLTLTLPDTSLVRRLRREMIRSPTDAAGESFNDAITAAIRIVQDHG